MATHGRQQYFADEHTLSKEQREFAIAADVQQKIDGIEEGAQVNVIETVKVNGEPLTPDVDKAVDITVPGVIDNLYSISTTDALSARQGKVLYDYLQNIASRGRYLSNWDCATGLAVTNPEESPYTYRAGDYFSVSNVAGSGGTNYRPSGSSYVIGQASTVVETETVTVSDFYLYDGTNWLLLSNSARAIAVDSSLSTTSTNPVENRVVTNALNTKADVTYVDAHDTIVSSTAPANPTEGMIWYDTTNDVIKTYNGTSWDIVNSVEHFRVFNQNDLTTAAQGQELYDFVNGTGNIAFLKVNYNGYILAFNLNQETSIKSTMTFTCMTTGANLIMGLVELTLSNGTVTAISVNVGSSAVSQFIPGNAGTTGQILRRTANGYSWDDDTSVVTEAQYGQLTPVNGKVYFIKE